MCHVRVESPSVSSLGLALVGGRRQCSLSAQAQGTGIREVSASARSLIPLQTRLRYTTMIVLPEGEEILDVICGDKDFWVISSTHNIAHVKPAKEGAATNLNLVTASGAVYSFLLTEKNGAAQPDLKVYVNADPNAPKGKPKYYSAAQVEGLQAELTEATAAVEAANRRATESIAAYQQQYPTKLQFVYGSPRYEKPFLVRSIWHDGQFTYIKADATELPALYEVKDGKPALVNFQVHAGHVRRAEGAGRGLPGARQGAIRLLAAGAVMYGRHPSGCERRTRPAVSHGHRPSPVPRGVLPRGVQTWVMAGRRRRHARHHAHRRTARAAGATSAAAAPAQAPSADRVRDYQDRLRAARGAGAARRAGDCAGTGRAAGRRTDEPQPPPPQDPDRRRSKAARVREPVRQQRRAEPATGDRAAGRRPATRRQANVSPRSDSANPSVDEIADAVVRATT